jgi:hypothetical protein
LEDRRATEPAILFTTGSTDILDINGEIEERDFALTDAVLREPGVPAMCRENLPGFLPAAEAARRFGASLEPLRTTLRFLSERGFTRLGVLGIPPPTVDERAMRLTMHAIGHVRRAGHERPAYIHKTVLTVNAALRAICAEEGVRFFERWNSVSHNGLVLPPMLRDFVHLTSDASAAAVADVVAWLRTPAGTTAGREPAAPDRYRPEIPPEERGKRVAALHALVGAGAGMRVLDAGPTDPDLTHAVAADGAEVVSIGAAGDGGERSYDVAIASGVLDDLGDDDAGRLYADLSVRLRPAGRLVVHTTQHDGMIRTQQRPATLRRQLQGVFEHVHVWVGTTGDPGGSLARNVTDENFTSSEVFAVASNAPIDREALLRRITMEPLPEIAGDAVALGDLAAPRRAASGSTIVAEVTLTNAGDVRLASFGETPVLFAYHWSDIAGPACDGRGRGRLALPCEPGSARRYAIEVETPPGRGPHTLHVTLVQEMVRWFDAAAEMTIDLG